MKPRPPSGGRGFFVVLLQAILILALGPVLLEAGTALFQTGSIEVGDVRAAPTPPVAGVGAVYLRITNHGAKSDSLMAIESPAAAKVEIHRSTLAEGVMQMRAVGSLECPPHGTVNIEPGALHIMLIGLKQPLVAGSSFPLTLKFREAGMLVVQVSVKALD
jgi:copper(I)-binding protein